MSYLHCHNCNWGQDDFWNEHYKALHYKVKELQDYLLKDRVYVDPVISRKYDNLEPEYDVENNSYYVDSRKYVAMLLRKEAYRIENMAVKTMDE